MLERAGHSKCLGLFRGVDDDALGFRWRIALSIEKWRADPSAEFFVRFGFTRQRSKKSTRCRAAPKLSAQRSDASDLSSRDEREGRVDPSKTSPGGAIQRIDSAV